MHGQANIKFTELKLHKIAATLAHKDEKSLNRNKKDIEELETQQVKFFRQLTLSSSTEH